MSSMAESDSLPKKLPIKQLKTNPHNKPSQKRSVSINMPAANKIHKRNKTSNSPHHSYILKKDKDIQTDPQPSPITLKVQNISPSLLHKLDHNKSSGLPPLIHNRSKSQLTLQDFERDFLLRERAKRFILKMKQQKKEADKKMSQIKDKLQQNRSKRMEIQDLERKMLRQLELTKKREKLDHMLRQLEFNRERRQQDKRRREAQQQKASRLNQDPQNQIQRLDRRQLDQILKHRSKKAKPLPKQQQIAFALIKGKPSKTQQNNQKISKERAHAKQQVKNHKKKSKDGKIATNLENHLYLSLDDQNLLEKIKQNIERLQTLSCSDIISCEADRKKIRRK